MSSKYYRPAVNPHERYAFRPRAPATKPTVLKVSPWDYADGHSDDNLDASPLPSLCRQGKRRAAELDNNDYMDNDSQTQGHLESNIYSKPQRPAHTKKKPRRRNFDSSDNVKVGTLQPAIDAERAASRTGFKGLTALPGIAIEELSSHSLTAAEAEVNLRTLLPSITDAAMVKLKARAVAAKGNATPPSKFHPNRSTWPQYNNPMDKIFEVFAANEPTAVDIPFTSAAVGRGPENLQKPWGHPNSAVVVCAAYPTLHSTIIPRFGDMFDPTNSSLRLVLRKLGLLIPIADQVPTSVLMLNAFSRRIDRKEISKELIARNSSPTAVVPNDATRKTYGDPEPTGEVANLSEYKNLCFGKLLQYLRPDIVEYHTRKAMDIIFNTCTAPFCVIFGEQSMRMYLKAADWRRIRLKYLLYKGYVS
ncbi:hypothetical protein CC80DRAFT_20586 [Byssothecium circinans]|uniref:Uncharacterized protein n=1 Tax=Byssothecium circinans TaxID=147558 RepID=A0A6A5U2C2_9PLEO|nr:hypothetical protein CC80DRAFT_20586 [Byssothecium circinans]